MSFPVYIYNLYCKQIQHCLAKDFLLCLLMPVFSVLFESVCLSTEKDHKLKFLLNQPTNERCFKRLSRHEINISNLLFCIYSLILQVI